MSHAHATTLKGTRDTRAMRELGKDTPEHEMETGLHTLNRRATDGRRQQDDHDGSLYPRVRVKNFDSRVR